MGARRDSFRGVWKGVLFTFCLSLCARWYRYISSAWSPRSVASWSLALSVTAFPRVCPASQPTDRRNEGCVFTFFHWVGGFFRFPSVERVLVTFFLLWLLWLVAFFVFFLAFLGWFGRRLFRGAKKGSDKGREFICVKYEASFLVNVTYCFFLMCLVFARMYDVRSVCVCLKVFGERYKLR